MELVQQGRIPQLDAGIAGGPARAADTEGVDDATLMLRYRDGDAQAFAMLYARHKRGLYCYLGRLCHDREVAGDLFQEVWGKVIASRERYEPRAQFNTFLFRIAHNCAMDHFRRSRRQPVSRAEDLSLVQEQLPASDSERPDAQSSRAQLHAAYRSALRDLPQEQRDVFLLYEETGLSLEAIGGITGVAMETAKSRLRYAVAKLRASLKRFAPGAAEPSIET